MPFKQSMMQAPARHSRGKRVVKCNAPPHVQEVKCVMPNKRGEAMERPVLNYSQPGKPIKGKNTSQKQYSLLLTILVFTAVATYAGLYNYSIIFPLNDNSTKHLGRRSINAKDVLFSPRLFPSGFWFLTATTFTFVSSVILIFVAICLQDGCKCGFGVRVLSSFVLAALFVSYVVMVKQVVPHFVVITWNGHILTGFEMLCLCTLFLALLSLAVALMVRWLWSFVRRSGRAIVGKVVGDCTCSVTI